MKVTVSGTTIETVLNLLSQRATEIQIRPLNSACESNTITHIHVHMKKGENKTHIVKETRYVDMFTQTQALLPIALILFTLNHSVNCVNKSFR